jgi:hypothetical protein
MKITAAATFLAFLAVLPGGALSFTNPYSSNRKYNAINGNPSTDGGIFLPNNVPSRTHQPGWNKRVYNMILMAIPVLENWTITSKGEASGIVKNHPDPNIFDGELLTTSKLSTSKDKAREGAIVITSSGSKYKLGKPRGSTLVQRQQQSSSSSSLKFSWGSFRLPSSQSSQEEKAVSNSTPSFGKWGFSSRIPVLDNWSVTVRGEVNGVVSNHPDSSISDGDTITTSKILEDRNALREGSIVSTSTGSKYTLGKKRMGLMFSLNGVGSPSAVSKGGTFRSGSNNVQQSYSSSASSSTVNGGDSSASSSSSNASSFGNPFSGTFEMLGKSMSRTTENLTSNGSQQIANVLSSFSIKKTPNVNVASSSNVQSPMSKSIKEEAARIANLRDLKLKYGVNGKTVGDGKYLLCDKPQRSTSGKSNIWSAYRADKNGLPTGEKLTVKVSTNFDAISRESDNYNRVCSGLFPGRFVEKAEFLPETNGFPAGEFKSSCALVIESGRKDLKAILAERGGRGFEGRAMRDAASAALQCIQAMHSSGIVWTDLKTENFVIVSDEIGDNGYLPGVKGIDLESAMPRGSNPVDFSPEACPPEFANAFISGEGLRFKLDYSYDIWSYGMMLYELTTGRSYFGNKTPAQITKSLQYTNFEADVSLVNDSKLRDLIRQCLQADPKKRPSVTQLLLHPYFLTSGVGPFGW